jgi:hypothetical protein
MQDVKRGGGFEPKRTGHNFKNSPFHMPFSIREESEHRSAVAYLQAIKDHPECN